MWRQNNIEIIVSKSNILAEAIGSNLPAINNEQVYHVDPNDQKIIYELPKINILILDEPLKFNIPLHNIQSIINPTGVNLKATDVFLVKPVKLIELLQIIKLCRSKNRLFCRINYNWIYDEQMCKLMKEDSIIRLTEKENEIFKHLLLSKKYRMIKEQLFQDVWQYHPESNSTTFETHVSRLKQKLPVGLLQVQNNCYELHIKDIA